MIKAVLLDIDNTILDFDAYVKEALEKGFSAFSLGFWGFRHNRRSFCCSFF